MATSVLSISGGSHTPDSMGDLAIGILGVPDKLRVSRMEHRIDFYDTDYQTLLRRLLAIGKQKSFTYPGKTNYFGCPASCHEIKLYDKGLEEEEIPGYHFRIESTTVLKGKERPLLTDFLLGKWRLEKPFRKTFLVNLDGLPLTKEEQAVLDEKGLTHLFMSLPADRKDYLTRRYINPNIIMDLNAAFKEWEDNHWVAPGPSQPDNRYCLSVYRADKPGKQSPVLLQVPQSTLGQCVNWGGDN